MLTVSTSLFLTHIPSASPNSINIIFLIKKTLNIPSSLNRHQNMSQPLSYQIPVLTCKILSQNLHLVLTYLFPILQPELSFQNEDHIIPPLATFCNTTMASFYPKNKDRSVWHCFEACMGGPYFFRFISNLSSSVSYTPAILDF